MLHPPPISTSNERTKAVVLDLAKQWKVLEEKRLEHRSTVAAEEQRLAEARASHEQLCKDETAAIQALKVR